MDEKPEVARPSAVRVAPTVLMEIAQDAARVVPGVERLVAPSQDGVNRLWGRVRMQDGVCLRTDGGAVSLSVHLIAASGISLPVVARQVQRDVVRSILNLAGTQLQRLDVVIEDIEAHFSLPTEMSVESA